MTARRADLTSYLALLGVAAVLVLVMQRQSSTVPPRGLAEPDRPASAALAEPATETSGNGRGRHSRSPRQIPWKGWKDVLWRTYESTGEDRLLAIAAGVVFYGLLAVFPAITALVSCYGLFADPATISDNLRSLALMLPDGSFQIVQDQITRVIGNGQTRLGATFLFGLALALWSANAGMKAVIDALNVVYGEREKRGFIALNLLSLAFTACAIAGLLLMVGAVVALPLIISRVGLGEESKTIVSIARWPLLMGMLLIALGVLYRFGPSRPGARWQWISVGACAATLMWFAGSYLLSWYLSNFANYSATYGSLGAAIGLMTWMWMSAIVVLFGAELNSEIEHQTAVDTTVGTPKPMGARGAAMADELGPARA